MQRFPFESAARQTNPLGARLDTSAPVHHHKRMRLTLNLENDLYAVAKSLSRAEDCTISAAVNRLLRRSLPGGAGSGRRTARPPKRRNGLPISRGRAPVTADLVKQLEAKDDRG